MQSVPSETLMLFALGFVLVILSVAVLIGTSVWIYRDASRRGDQYAVLWVVGNVIAFPLILIIYLIVRTGRPG